MEALASQMGNGREGSSSPNSKQELQPYSGSNTLKPNQVGETSLYGVPIVSLVIDGQERLCLAQISNTLLKNYSYNEIHNRRVALGITCVQCTPVQLEILRRAGAMPISSRRCGMITKREAERLCKSFLGEHKPPKLPENFAFDVVHECAWGSRGSFIPARYNSSRAKCIKCGYCSMYFSPNKFIFHSHRTPEAKYTQPDAANFNSWRRHLKLSDKTATDELSHAWEDVKAMFNGGTRKRTFSLHGGGGGGGGGTGGPGKGVAGGGGGGPGCGGDLPPGPPPHKSLRCATDDDPTGPPGPPPPPHPQRGLGLSGGGGGGPGGGNGAGVRSYPVIPVPSKGFGLLQKLPPPLFPHPYGFPTAFGLCPKKDDPVLGGGDPKGAGGAGAGGGAGGAGGGGGHLPPGAGPGPGGGTMFWGHQPAGAAKDAAAVAAAAAAATVYPTFPMFWPAAGSLPVPPYPAQSQAKAVAAAVAAAAAAAAAAAGNGGAGGPGGAGGTGGPGGGPVPPGGAEALEVVGEPVKEGGLGGEERCPSALSRGPGDEDGVEEPLPPSLGPLPLAPPQAPPPHQARKGSYVSAFRPVVKDAESIAKLYGTTREAYGAGAARGPGGSAAGGYLSPDFLSEGSSSYRSASPDVDTGDEPEVDVESNRFPDDEEAEPEEEADSGQSVGGGGPDADLTPALPTGVSSSSSATSSSGDCPADSSDGGSPHHSRRHVPQPTGRPGFGDRAAEEAGRRSDRSPETGSYEMREPCGALGGSGPGPGPGPGKVYAQERDEHLQTLKSSSALGTPASYLCNPEANEPDKEDNHSTAEDLETRKSYQDQRSVSQPSPVTTDRGDEGLTLDVTGTPIGEKDIENLARGELQKLLLEQMELRKKLEREFQSLKDNFQDQMKRELAYREEMVQQLQIVRDTLCNELDQERKARYAIQQKLKEAHDALHHFSCKMLTPRHCTGNCSFKPPLLP
ncbi:SKI family transcriptional corepressor 1 isoform X2 [Trichosurus vulpecula]|nr:SKI family transcriptional corepressor 1 isoform X2 [Trichosurus vulpecula]